MRMATQMTDARMSDRPSNAIVGRNREGQQGKVSDGALRIA